MDQPTPHSMTRRQRFGMWLGGLALKAATSTGAVRFLPDWIREPMRDFGVRKLVTEGYLNSAAYACLRVIVESFAEPELHVHEATEAGDKVILGDHPLRQLLARPNRFMSEDEFFEFLITYAGIGGNFYVLKERAVGGWPIALWPFHDGQMTPALDAQEWISHYWLHIGDGEKIPVATEDVIHWRWSVDPRFPQLGLSPLAAAARDVSMDSELRRYGHALAHNDAVPRTLVRVEGNLDDELIGQMQKQWKKSFGGTNRGAVAVVDRSVKEVMRIGASLQELMIEAAHNIPESRVAACYGGAAVGYLAGLNVFLQRSTFSNVEEAELALHRRILMAKWRSVAATMTEGLLREFSDDPALTLEFDTSRVQALAALRQAEEKHAAQMFGNGVWTRNEARAATGRAPLAEDFVVELSNWLPGMAELAPAETAKGRPAPAARAVRALAVERRRITGQLERSLGPALRELQDEALDALTVASNGRG